MQLLIHPNVISCLAFSKVWATSEIVEQLRRIRKLQRLGIYAASALLLLKTYQFIGFYAIVFLLLTPIGLKYVNKVTVSNLSAATKSIRGIKKLLDAQMYIHQRSEQEELSEQKILYRQIKLTDIPSKIKFDQYIEGADGEYWHISSDGEDLKIKNVDASAIYVLKKRWKK